MVSSRLVGRIATATTLVLAVVIVLAAAGCGTTTVRVAAPQSLADSGVLNSLVTGFAKTNKVSVEVVPAKTSAAALKAASSGKADVALVCAPMAVSEFVKNGYGVKDVPVMYNDLIVVGPASDPAQIKGLDCPAKSVKKIGTAGSTFVISGTGSDIDSKVTMYWQKAGLDPAGKAWYITTGKDKVSTLKTAGQKQAYTIIDRQTFMQNKSKVPLVELVTGCAMLMNQYSAVQVNSTKVTGVDSKVASQFVNYVTSKAGQDAIGSFKKYDMVIYHPNAETSSSMKM
ncbi:MAG TPA: substrate-binding domain-containing protein [Candidatus Anoxymicrobiaceae bacterium]